MPRKKTTTTTTKAKAATKTKATTITKTTAKKTSKKPSTRVKIKFDVGYANGLYLRGSGPGLSWDKGIPLKNTGSDEWIWETGSKFKAGEFKVLINDKIFEDGEDHKFSPGKTVNYTPAFSGW